jgi:glycosyltransferase involved in cell wall biosynthesis
VRRTPLPADFEWRRELVERGLDRASVVIAPSGAFAVETARAYDVQTPVLAVHNGRRPIPAGVVPQADFVFTASRLWDEGKNIATLDAAAAQLDGPFEAAGPVDGPNGAHIDLHQLRLLGEISAARMAGLLAARPVFASAALYEPFGLSVLEAAHAGCALVLSDIATHRELWRDCALFVPARDPGAFARAFRRLLADRDRRNALGRAAHARALLYSPERMASRMAAIYARLANAAAAPMPFELVSAA